MVYKFFDKKTSATGIKIRICQTSIWQRNYTNQLLENSRKRKYTQLLQTIWGAGHADMQLVSKFNKRFTFLLCAIDIFSKQGWVISLKDKK